MKEIIKGYKRKIVKCGECNKEKLLIYEENLERVCFICKCGALNEYTKDNIYGIGKVIKEV